MFRPQLCIDSSGLRRKSAEMASESCKIENIVPCDMPVDSTISRTFIRRSLKTISWILSIISGVVTSTGRPERCSSFVDVRLR